MRGVLRSQALTVRELTHFDQPYYFNNDSEKLGQGFHESYYLLGDPPEQLYTPLKIFYHCDVMYNEGKGRLSNS